MLSAPGVWLASLFFVLVPADAIVIRHDTGYTRYIASATDYPGVFPLEQQGHRNICVATLVAPQWALTAAHCATETTMQAALRDGQAYKVQIAGQTHHIEAVHLHPTWSGESLERLQPGQVDLALLRLSAPVNVDAVVELYRGEDELAQTMTFLGWGYTGIGTTGSAINDGRLRFAHNTVILADEHLRFEFDDPRVNDDQAVEFEGIPGLDDSGGPALLTERGSMLLAGIAVGELTGGADYVGAGRYGAIVVYERVSQHLDWVDSVIPCKLTSLGITARSAR